MNAIGFAIVHHDPVAVELGHAIGRARIERGGFTLGHFLHQAVKFRGRSLIEAGLLFQTQNADRLKQTQRADSVGIRGVLGGFKADLHMALGGQIVDFVRLGLLNDADQVGRIRQIAVMQVKAGAFNMGIFVNIFDTAGVERRRAALNAMNFIALFQQ